MKYIRILSLLVFVLTGLESSAYEPMLQDGRSWILSLWYWDHSVGHERWAYRRFEVVGDEVIAGIPCKKIVETSLDPKPEEYENPSLHAYRYACEEDGRVCLIEGETLGDVNNILEYYPEDLDQIRKWLLMDFNLNVGDSVEDDYEVIARDVITVAGEDRTRISYRRENGGTLYWVEGIGSMYLSYQTSPGIIICGAPKRSAAFLKEGVDFFTHLAECRQDGKVIFQMENFFNPDAPFVDFDYAAVREIPAAAPGLESGVLYDLQG